MTALIKLQSLKTLSDVAIILGFKPSALSYILYVKDKNTKYTKFEIPKRSGGTRIINAPDKDLKCLQKRLSILLQDCIDEINQEKEIHKALSHGFRRKYSIITNAEKHRNKRYVFNIDIEDFFGSINYGRVYGFFIKNHNFLLSKKVATVFSQIICHNNALPQGSPCSPVVSNLIAHILDIKLASLAHKTGSTYSRYADDITFSSNKKIFPQKIARRLGGSGHGWRHGTNLERIIVKSGFIINTTKTRMQYKDSRQSVTGLIVNKKIGVSAEYRRTARSMAHSLFKTGAYYKKVVTKDPNGDLKTEKIEGTLKKLNGILGFIDQLDIYNKDKNTKSELRELNSREQTYRNFLFYKLFYSPEAPRIVCEGKTDNVYIKEAIKSLSASCPKLIDVKTNQLKVDFFNYTKITDRVCSLAGGTPDLNKFVIEYSKKCKVFKIARNNNPVIILIDNDVGSKGLFKIIKSRTKAEKVDGSENFYYLGGNLYVVVIPKINMGNTMIEDFFESSVLKTILNGKSFSKSNQFNPSKQYGKHVFANEVIKKRSAKINFKNFKPILDRVKLAIEDYEKKIKKT